MQIRHSVPGSSISWFKTGGTIDTLYLIESIEDLTYFLQKHSQNHFHILGMTTNSLIDDKGLKLAVKIKLNHIKTLQDNKIYAQAGTLTTQFVRHCIQNNIGGLEFMSTIPGNIGGLLKMNAGAYGKEIKDVLCSLEVMDTEGNLHTLSADKMHYTYRSSTLPSKHIIVSGTFQGYEQNATEITSSLSNLQTQRIQTQPLNIKTLGSTFKNPPEHYAAKLLTDANLKGHVIGGARFSNKHANFIENFNHATSSDFLRLIRHAQEVVKKQFGILLEPEVKLFTDDK